MRSEIQSRFNLQGLLRENIMHLIPYSSARDEFSGNGSVFLDANENPFQNGVNRYPDPQQRELKQRIGKIKKVDPSQIVLGNGSDEVIDLLFRVFCEPNTDNVVICTPTYGMYEVAAGINAVEHRDIPLDSNFQPDVEAVLAAVDQNTKLLFLCSPNNPTANLFEESKVVKLLENFTGLVIVDEAYIDFAPGKSLVNKLEEYPNLVVLQTLSKAWGMAGIRLGICLASREITGFLNRIKPPYNVNVLSQEKALELLQDEDCFGIQVASILKERDKLNAFVRDLDFVERVYPSDANFILLKVRDAKGLYEFLIQQGIIIRDRSKVTGLNGCVRISIGTQDENEILCSALQRYDSKIISR